MLTFTRDITQASVECDTPLERNVYISAAPQMQLAAGTVLKVAPPLYGIPESGLDWYLTYTKHLADNMNMFRSTIHPCVLVQPHGNRLNSLVTLQVDASMAVGTDQPLRDEETAS